jgi:hypothetical protein
VAHFTISFGNMMHERMDGMSDEQVKVLQMVAAGTLTPEQAGELLAALDVDTAPPVGSRTSAGAPRRLKKETRVTPANARYAALSKLGEAHMHGVTPDFIRDMADAGCENLTLHQIIELRIHGVSPDFVRQLHDAGFSDLSAKEIVMLRVQGMNPEIIRSAQDAGLLDLSVEDLNNTPVQHINHIFVEDGFDEDEALLEER